MAKSFGVVRLLSRSSVAVSPSTWDCHKVPPWPIPPQGTPCPQAVRVSRHLQGGHFQTHPPEGSLNTDRPQGLLEPQQPRATGPARPGLGQARWKLDGKFLKKFPLKKQKPKTVQENEKEANTSKWIPERMPLPERPGPGRGQRRGLPTWPCPHHTVTWACRVAQATPTPASPRGISALAGVHSPRQLAPPATHVSVLIFLRPECQGLVPALRTQGTRGLGPRLSGAPCRVRETDQ